MCKRNILFVVLALFSATCSSQKKESWIDKPKAAWPTIALTNHFRFLNGEPYDNNFPFRYANTSFLIDMGKDTLAATARHMLWIARPEPVNTGQISRLMQQLTMVAKSNGRDSAVIGQLLNGSSFITERDWLVFSVRQSTPGIHPLKPRFTPVKAGEKVYILSSAHDGRPASIEEWAVVNHEGMNIRVQRTAKEHPGDASGSPLIDANGYLIGIMSSNTTFDTTGVVVSVAISTEYLQEVLKNKKRQD